MQVTRLCFGRFHGIGFGKEVGHTAVIRRPYVPIYTPVITMNYPTQCVELYDFYLTPINPLVYNEV